MADGCSSRISSFLAALPEAWNFAPVGEDPVTSVL